MDHVIQEVRSWAGMAVLVVGGIGYAAFLAAVGVWLVVKAGGWALAVTMGMVL